MLHRVHQFAETCAIARQQAPKRLQFQSAFTGETLLECCVYSSTLCYCESQDLLAEAVKGVLHGKVKAQVTPLGESQAVSWTSASLSEMVWNALRAFSIETERLSHIANQAWEAQIVRDLTIPTLKLNKTDKVDSYMMVYFYYTPKRLEEFAQNFSAILSKEEVLDSFVRLTMAGYLKITNYESFAMPVKSLNDLSATQANSQRSSFLKKMLNAIKGL